MKKVLLRMQALCSRREYCSSDILRKTQAALSKAGIGDEGSAGEILSSLVSDGFVDDLRFATAFCREKSSLTGWGGVKIRYALEAKRIPSEVITEALGQTDRDRGDERLRRLLEAKRKSLGDDPQAKLKLLRYAVSRGYSYDEVRRFVDAPDD